MKNEISKQVRDLSKAARKLFQDILERELANDETIHVSVENKLSAQEKREQEEARILAELKESENEIKAGKGKVLRSLADLD